MKFYICRHCGNVITKLTSAQVPVKCCGEEMQLLEAGVTDAAQEKHVPAVEVEGNKVVVNVGSVDHPMLEEHSITMIAAVSGDTVTVRFPKPGDEPTLTVDSKEPVTAYEICNLHGFWKGNE